MNEHLQSIFEIVLPAIESADIKYWVYGGLGYASIVGRFYRFNSDVDFFVLDSDFKNVEEVLKNICEENEWKIRKTLMSFKRPKVELILKEKERERLSVVPVFKTDEVEFRFIEGSKRYPLDVLMRVKRNLEGFVFYTPQDIFLKRLLLDYFESKNKYPKKRIEDARQILSEQEFKKFFPNQSYLISK